MADFGYNQKDIGDLDIRVLSDTHRIEVYFIPTKLPRDSSSIQEVKLVELNYEIGVVKIFPINTLQDSDRYLKPKYKQIRTFTMKGWLLEESCEDFQWEELIETLPAGFIKDYQYGLGLLKDCNRLIDLIEECTQCNEIVFTEGDNVTIEGEQFLLGQLLFVDIWSEMCRINDRGNRAKRRVKDAFVQNKLATLLGLPPVEASLGRHPHSQLITKAALGSEELNESERLSLISVLTSESTTIAAEAPKEFYQLRRNIELVSLEQLIEKFEEALNRGEKEKYWQQFFEGNTFALQQIFGAPMLPVRSGTTVGGLKFSGDGYKIADYLFKNSLTNNVALVEIKRPTMSLLKSKGYRTGVFGPSKELNATVIQVLDQAYSLTKDFSGLKDRSRRWDVESYAVACYVVAGRTPDDSEPDKQKSFEMYRANSRAVSIVTYDEILEQLRLLHDFLSSTVPSVEEG